MNSSCDSMSSYKLSEIIHNQAIFNVGTAGHVMHGKSTLVAKITGTKTQRHKKERARNITINLGYANTKLFINRRTGKVYAFPSKSGSAKDPESGEPLDLLYHISFVDCPGHEAYMSTMVSGSKIMDCAVVVIAANEPVPQPQTHQHIMALDYSRIANKSYLLNKMDLLTSHKAGKMEAKVLEYLKHYELIGASESEPDMFPISAATGANVDSVIQHLAAQVHSKLDDIVSSAQQPLCMHIVRSYNINRPNTPIEELQGAVVGGSIQSGTIAVGDQIEIRPGILIMKDTAEGRKKVIQPLVARVESLRSDENSMDVAIPGGLVGVNLTLFAGLSGGDKLKGQVLGHVGTLPDVYDVITGKYNILDLRTDMSEALPVLTKESQLSVVVNGIQNVRATIVELTSKSKGGGPSKGKIQLKLSVPVVMDLSSGANVAFMMNNRLIGNMSVKEGQCSMPIVYPEDTDHSWTAPQREIINDLKPYEPAGAALSYDEMLGRIQYRSAKIKRERVAKPSINIVNLSTNIAATELATVIDSLTCPEGTSVKDRIDIKALIVQNIGKDIPNSEPRFNNEGTLVMRGRHKVNTINGFLDKLQDKIFECPSCTSVRTTVSWDKGQGFYIRHCHQCPSVTYLHSLDMSKI